MSGAGRGGAATSSYIRYDAWRDLRLVPAAAAAWCGAGWVSTATAATALGTGFTAAVAAVGLLVACRRRRRTLLTTVALALAAASAVLVVAGVRTATTPPALVEASQARRGVELIAVVVGDPMPLAGSPTYRVRLRALSLQAGGSAGVDGSTGHDGWVSAAGTVVVLTRDVALRDGFVAGSTVSVRGRLAPADPRDRADARLSLPGGAAHTPAVRTVAEPGPVHRAANRARAGLREAAGEHGPQVGGLLPSLVVGDTENLTEQQREDMRRSGLAHLSAVSGTNVTIVVGAVLLLTRLRHLPRPVQVLIAALALAGFVVVARPEPSVVRAAVMGSVGLLGLVLGRRGGALSALGSAVIAVCLVAPGLAREVGFALSVAATAGLVLLAPPLTDSLERVLPRWLALALAVPLAAQVACGPILVLLQPQVAWLGVVANLLAGPAVVPATLLGAGCAVLAWWWPAGGSALAWVAGWPVRWILTVAETTSGMPGAVGSWPAGWTGAGLLLVFGLLVVSVIVAFGRLPRFSTGGRRSPGGGPRAAGGTRWVATGLVIVLVTAAGWAWARVRAPVEVEWRVAACDVGQGEAVAVRTGVDSAVLFDAGPDPGAVDRCLSRLGVKRLDLVVLSHFHADHVDGLSGAVERRVVGEVWLDPLREPEAAYRQVTGVLTGVRTQDAVAGMEAVIGDVRLRVIQAGPVQAASGHPVGTVAQSDAESDLINGSSVVVLVQAPGLTLLTTGDLVPDAQRRLRRALHDQGVTSVDVVTVSHHGSRHQDAGLYRQLGPRLALISVGEDNDYGHPAPSTLALLDSVGAVVRRTDTDSLVLVGEAPALWVVTR